MSTLQLQTCMNVWFDITKNKYTSKTYPVYLLIHLTIVDKRCDINIQKEKKPRVHPKFNQKR